MTDKLAIHIQIYHFGDDWALAMNVIDLTIFVYFGCSHFYLIKLFLNALLTILFLYILIQANIKLIGLLMQVTFVRLFF